jgi:hypothetical protein
MWRLWALTHVENKHFMKNMAATTCRYLCVQWLCCQGACRVSGVQDMTWFGLLERDGTTPVHAYAMCNLGLVLLLFWKSDESSHASEWWKWLPLVCDVNHHDEDSRREVQVPQLSQGFVFHGPRTAFVMMNLNWKLAVWHQPFISEWMYIKMEYHAGLPSSYLSCALACPPCALLCVTLR